VGHVAARPKRQEALEADELIEQPQRPAPSRLGAPNPAWSQHERSDTDGMSDADGAGNLATFSVTELSGALKRTIEDRFGLVRVRGEVSGWRGPHASGHCYFSLKDQGARIDAVIWKGQYLRMKTRPEEGLEVIATGRITTFPGKSSYQIIVEAVEPAGVGALMALLEQRRRKLAAEGLFDAARKRPLPYLPAVIGVVTSPTGAVIRDILHRLADRFPRRVLVWPARVQGEGSAGEVAAAIAGFGALALEGEPPRPDVLIVARGGGALEDLWPFNEEVVVRAAAASAIPLIAAVGHETDTTLIDYAADRRAPTPTAAAEMAVPVRLDLSTQILSCAARLARANGRLLSEKRTALTAAARGLPKPMQLVEAAQQRLDEWGERLGRSLSVGLDQRQRRLHLLMARLASPAARIAHAQSRLAAAGRMLDTAAAARLRETAGRLQQAGALLESFSYARVLERGFALVQDRSGHAITARAGVRPGMALRLQFHDGAVSATADRERGGRTNNEPAAITGPAAAGDQGRLF
jgi:exodeoxyribonuclease VII large subunit